VKGRQITSYTGSNQSNGPGTTRISNDFQLSGNGKVLEVAGREVGNGNGGACGGEKVVKVEGFGGGGAGGEAVEVDDLGHGLIVQVVEGRMVSGFGRVFHDTGLRK
jgi:hypothetical protein